MMDDVRFRVHRSQARGSKIEPRWFADMPTHPTDYLGMLLVISTAHFGAGSKFLPLV